MFLIAFSVRPALLKGFVVVTLLGWGYPCRSLGYRCYQGMRFIHQQARPVRSRRVVSGIELMNAMEATDALKRPCLWLVMVVVAVIYFFGNLQTSSFLLSKYRNPMDWCCHDRRATW